MSRLNAPLFWLLLLSEGLAIIMMVTTDQFLWALFLFILSRVLRRLTHSAYHGKEVYFDPNILPPGFSGQDQHTR